MAPLLSSRLIADDFVLTISDADSDVPDYEEEEATEPTANGNGKKRKRGQDGASLRNGSREVEGKKEDEVERGNKRRRQDKQEEVKPALRSDMEDEREDHGIGDDRPKDDGAMNSDFEFQVGDVESGILEDFDAWGLGLGLGEEERKRGDRKGVDVDEIIARRMRKGEEGRDQVDDTEDGVVDGDGVDLDVDEDEEGFDGMEDGDDELLAEDGFGMGAVDEEEEEEDMQDGSEEGSEDEDADVGEVEGDEDSDAGSLAAPMPHPDDVASQASSEDEREDPVEAEKRAAFFAPEDNLEGQKPPHAKTSGSFQNMSLSRPILRGLAAVGFAEPTPIQGKTIPVALLGKDVVGGAVTGSGKTAAFMIPILERLLYRPKKVPTTRVAILMPTRELAVQCFNVAKKLASFTDITFAQVVGGFSLREQEQVLKKRPDVVIATPGRFIDHMRNSPSFAVDTLEILVLDEADRMLEQGFADELNEILSTIPKSRQTMLFSATVTDTVDKLIRLGLNRPVRLLVDAKKQTVEGLVQEFVRLRPGREEKRLGYLLYLCKNVYTDRVIIFFRQKKEAHRVRVVFGLLGLKAGELHGSMSQEQRINAVESFRSGKTSFLLATDLASRGLDIRNVATVLNYEAPQSHEIYLHRVGRTARAGRTGRSCTIAAEPDRRVVKAAVKAARAQGAKVVSRVVDPKDADEWDRRVRALEAEVEAVLREEKEEKVLRGVEVQVRKGENLIRFEGEIKGRPRRTWFESEKEKREAKGRGKVELNGVGEAGGDGNGNAGVGKGEKKGKLSGKEKKKLLARDEREGGVWKKRRVDGLVGRGGEKKRKEKSGAAAAAGGKERPKAKGNGKRARGGKDGPGKIKRGKT